MQISISKWEYWKYNSKYDLRSLIWFTYYSSLIWLIVWFIINIFFPTISQWITTLRIITTLIPIFITIISISIIIIHWLIFILSKIFQIDYENTKLAHWIEYIFWSIFPKKLYRNKYFNNIYLRSNKKKTIYYAILMIAVISITILIRNLLTIYPQFNNKINENRNILQNIITIDKAQYRWKLFNL